jgi:hypothetical protein
MRILTPRQVVDIALEGLPDAPMECLLDTGVPRTRMSAELAPETSTGCPPLSHSGDPCAGHRAGGGAHDRSRVSVRWP